jgi:hypothetical protein
MASATVWADGKPVLQPGQLQGPGRPVARLRHGLLWPQLSRINATALACYNTRSPQQLLALC